MKPDCYDYVRNYYKVPAHIGVRVSMGNDCGVIVKATEALNYVHVRFDGRKHAVPVHPAGLTYDLGDRRGLSGASD